MNPRLSAVVVGALTALISTLGLLPAQAAGAPAPGNPPGISRLVLTDAGGHRTAAAVAGGPDRAAVAIRTGAITADEFLVAGLTWAAGDQLPAEADIKLRVREDGHWSKWLEVESDAASDDPAARGGTEPFITGGANGVQVMVTGSPADLPADLRLSLVSAADDGAPTTSSTSSLSLTATEVATTSATTPAGAVVTRAGWGLTATEEDYTTQHWTPKFYPLQAAVVHHTAGTNNYTADKSAGIVHAIWVFHAQENGWGDIGYNFLVDKYGQMFEGRRHSLPQSGAYSVADNVPTGWSIEGAHATSYNKGGLGISALGDFTKTDPDQYTDELANPDNAELLRPISKLIAWKFNLANLDVVVDGARVPSGFISPGTASTYPAGTPLPRIFVHQDVAATLCPGELADAAVIADIYGQVDALITRAADTAPPGVSLSATNGTVTLTASDDSAVAPAIFRTTDGAQVFYSPDWYVTDCGTALVGVTNPRSCVVDTRYTGPFTLSRSSTVSYLAVDGSANTSAQQSTYVKTRGTVVSNTAPAVTITSPADGGTYATGATVAFAGTAVDAETGVLTAGLVWTSDGVQIGTGGSFTTGLADGPHTITATATDSGGLTGTASITVRVGEPEPVPAITLTVDPYKIKSAKYAKLTWTGGTPSFTIYRDGTPLATVDAPSYTDMTLAKTTVSATYKVCGANGCSADVRVTW